MLLPLNAMCVLRPAETDLERVTTRNRHRSGTKRINPGPKFSLAFHRVLEMKMSQLRGFAARGFNEETKKSDEGPRKLELRFTSHILLLKLQNMAFFFFPASKVRPVGDEMREFYPV